MTYNAHRAHTGQINRPTSAGDLCDATIKIGGRRTGRRTPCTQQAVAVVDHSSAPEGERHLCGIHLRVWQRSTGGVINNGDGWKLGHEQKAADHWGWPEPLLAPYSILRHHELAP